MAIYTNQNKNSSTFVNQEIGFGDPTWDDANWTWDDANGTWDTARDIWATPSKASTTMTNQVKN